MTIHPSFKNLLAYKDGQLDRKTDLKVGRHLAVCSRCRQDVAQIDAERQALDSLCREGATVEVPPFAAVFGTIRLKAAENHMAEKRSPGFWRTPLVGFALAMLLLMSFNTLVFTGLLLHPLYAVPAPTLLPVILASMVPAYVAARFAARRFTFAHKLL